MKAATRTGFIVLLAVKISIHAAREGGDDENGNEIEKEVISIHAAREGGDAV